MSKSGPGVLAGLFGAFGDLLQGIPIGAVLVVVLVGAAIALFAWKRKKDAAPPIQIAEQRTLTTDIQDFYKFRRWLSMQTPGSAVVAGNLAGAAVSPKIITMRDDPKGRFVMLRLRVKQEYIDKNDTAGGVRDMISARDFMLNAGGRSINPVFLFLGNLEEQPPDKAVLTFPGLKITQTKAGGQGCLRNRGR